MLCRDSPDRSGEDLDLRGLLPDPVLRHRGHGIRGERPHKLDIIDQIILCKADPFGECDELRLPHGGDHEHELEAFRPGRSAVSGSTDHADLIDPHVQHEFAPYSAEDIGLDLIGEMRPVEELSQRVELLLHGRIRDSDTEAALHPVCELSGEEGGVHSLRDGVDDLVPAEALGEDLLARDAVNGGDDDRIGADGGLQGVQSCIKACRLCRYDDKVGGLRLIGRDHVEADRSAVYQDRLCMVFFISLRIHEKCDGLRGQTFQKDRCKEGAQGAHADEGHIFQTFHNNQSFRSLSFLPVALYVSYNRSVQRNRCFFCWI